MARTATNGLTELCSKCEGGPLGGQLARYFVHENEKKDDSDLIFVLADLMIDITRVMLAYGILAIVVAIAIPLAIRMRLRQSRDRLRRRGIKRHGR